MKATRKLTEGTMKALTVELLRRVGKPMNSGEVAKRMKIGPGYASVNLSQLRRDGFLSHTPEGYTVI
jgi:Mn-dependent DtxR family transcriptional regulator